VAAAYASGALALQRNPQPTEDRVTNRNFVTVAPLQFEKKGLLVAHGSATAGGV
jgi:hypothetical protein